MAAAVERSSGSCPLVESQAAFLRCGAMARKASLGQKRHNLFGKIDASDDRRGWILSRNGHWHTEQNDRPCDKGSAALTLATRREPLPSLWVALEACL